MAKLVRRAKKNIQTYLIAAFSVYIWYVGTFDFIKENPNEVSTGLVMLSLPFLVALTFKSVRKEFFGLFLFLKSLIRYKSILPTDLREIDHMDGFEFERFLKPVFERHGYLAEVTQGSGDFGADLILHKGRKKYVVQAKRYNSNIGVSAVQQVVAAVNYYKATSAIVVTNQYFTHPAIELAKVNKVILIDRDKLSKMIL